MKGKKILIPLLALIITIPAVLSVSSPSGEFTVSPDTVYINWTDGGFGSYTANITINLTKDYGANDVNISIGNSSDSAILIPIYYGISKINLSECYFSNGDAKFTNKIPCERLIIIPNNISNFTYANPKNFSLTFNYTFLLQYPGRYKTYEALTIYNTTNFTEQANLTVYVDVPVLFSSNQKSVGIGSYKLPGGSPQSFSIPANNKGKEDAHFYYINKSSVENVSGIYINVSDSRLAIFLFDEKESTLFMESSNTSKGTYEIFASSSSPLSDTGKLYIYGNDTNDIPYESHIVLSTLYSYNTSNTSQSFGFNNEPYKVNFSSGEKIFSSSFILKNKGVFNYSNLAESKEVYFVSGYVEQGYGNNTYWIMIPENTLNIFISMKFNSSGNYSVKLFNPDSKKVAEFFYRKGYYEEIVGKRKLVANYTGDIIPGLWRVEVINVSGASDFNLTIYSQLPASMIKTNYSLYSDKNIKYHGSGNDSKTIDLTFYANQSGVSGYYTSYLYYREGSGSGIKIPLSIQTFGSTPLIDYRFKEKTFNIVQNLERNLKKNITFYVQNTGNYNITNITITYKDLILDSQNYVNITNIYINETKYTGEFTIENNTWVPVDVEIEINKSIANKEGIYSGYVFFNMSNSAYKPTPYDYVKAVINLNLTRYVIVNSTSLASSEVNVTYSPKNISVTFKAYYANTSTKVSNEIELENITLVKIIHKNVSSAFKDITSSKYYYTGTTIWSGNDYQFNVTIPKGIWGGYYDLLFNITLKDTNKLIGQGKALLRVRGEALAVNILYHPNSMQNGTEAWLNISLTNYGLDKFTNAKFNIESSLISSITAIPESNCTSTSYSGKTVTFTLDTQKLCRMAIKIKSSSTGGSGTVYLKGAAGIWIQNASFSLTVTTPSSSSGSTSQDQQQSTQQTTTTTQEENVITWVKDLLFMQYPSSIQITQGKSEVISITVKNTGNITLFNLTLTVSGIESSWVSISPMTDLSPDKTHTFTVNITVPENTNPEKKSIKFTVTSGDFSKSIDSTLEILVSEKYKQEVEQNFTSLKGLYNNISSAYVSYKKKGIEDEEITNKLTTIETLLSQAENLIKTNDYVSAASILSTVSNLINETTTKLEELKKKKEKESEGQFIMIIGLIFIIFGAGFLIYLLLPPQHGYEPEKGFRYVPPHHRGRPRLKKLLEELKEIKNKILRKLRRKRAVFE